VIVPPTGLAIGGGTLSPEARDIAYAHQAYGSFAES
jgi:hypothetical protein